MSARADGKITLKEVSELLMGLGEIWKIKELRVLEVELPDGTTRRLDELSK